MPDINSAPITPTWTDATSGSLPSFLSKVIRPEDFGAVGDGTADDTDAINDAIAAAVAAKCPVELTAIYGVSETIRITEDDTFIIGHGRGTGLKGLSVDGPILITYDGVTAGNFIENVRLLDFGLSGTADAALVVTHCIRSVMSNISTDFLTATDAFVFENCFSNIYTRFQTNQATISGTSFKINQIVLNSTWNSGYTSTPGDYLMRVDAEVEEYSNPQTGGFGGLTFNDFCFQGGDTNGLFIRRGIGLTFNRPYFENCVNQLRIGDNTVVNAASNITINQPILYAPHVDSDYVLYLDNCTGVVINGPEFTAGDEIWLGAIPYFGGGVHMSYPRVLAAGTFESLLKITTDAPGLCAFSADYFQHDGYSAALRKGGSNIAGQLAKMTWTLTGVTMTTFQIPLVA